MVERWRHRQLEVYFIPTGESFSPISKVSEKDMVPVWLMCQLISESVAGKGDGGGRYGWPGEPGSPVLIQSLLVPLREIKLSSMLNTLEEKGLNSSTRDTNWYKIIVEWRARYQFISAWLWSSWCPHVPRWRSWRSESFKCRISELNKRPGVV